MMKFKKVLVVDDESSIRKFLRVCLEHENYDVIEASSAQEGLQELISQRAELVILDLGLPDLSGQDLIAKIRSWSQVPILVLTAQEDENAKAEVLDSGADDYLTKPFSVPELMARIRVAERHNLKTQNESPIFKTGQLEVNLAERCVYLANHEVHLTATEYALLKCLVQHAGRVVTHRQLLKDVWGPHSIEHTQYLRVYMGHLRKKLEPTPESTKILVNEPGIGYRLVIFSS